MRMYGLCTPAGTCQETVHLGAGVGAVREIQAEGSDESPVDLLGALSKPVASGRGHLRGRALHEGATHNSAQQVTASPSDHRAPGESGVQILVLLGQGHPPRPLLRDADTWMSMARKVAPVDPVAPRAAQDETGPRTALP